MKSRFLPAPRASLSLALGAALAIAAALSARADDWAPNLTATAAWDSNATHADQSADQVDSLLLKADLLASQRYPFGRDDALRLSTHLGAEWWPRYRALSLGAAGGRAAWEHKFGGSALAPTLSFEGAADAVVARETGRRGVAASLGVALRKRFNNLTRGTLAHEVAWFDARYGTYDRTASETALELDRDLNDVTRLTLGVRFRDGDIVSYAAGPRADLAALAPNQLDVDSFDRPMRAYRIDARSWSARLALVRALDERSAIMVGYEWRTTKRQPLTFENDVLAVSLVHQF